MTQQSLTLTTSLPTGDGGPGAARIPAEAANQWTHAGGFVLSLVAAGFLLPTAFASGDSLRLFGCTVYALTLVGLYAASTLSHSFDDPVRRNYYRMLDQVCIFLLMVGSYTPFGLVYALDGGWWLVLAAMWTVAVLGIVKRLRSGTESVPIRYFLALGWLPVPVIWRIFEVGQLPGLGLVVAGGLAYTGGTWFLANDHRRPYYHAVWHLCTITGSALHFFYVLQYVATPVA